MKKILFAFLLPCILITGCSDDILEGPPVISKIELNIDSIHDRTFGTYIVHLKSTKGSDPIFYSYEPYNSGETLVAMSNLQLMLDNKMKVYLDTINSKDRQIAKLKSEKETMERDLNEKTTLIRFLTGK